MSDLISVVVPVYNVESFLPACLDSLLAQTYKNIEIIVVDDGATDGSGAICDAYAKKHDKILAVHTENRGLSAARNEGMRHAKGAYIGFVDSDDWVEPDMFEILHTIAVQNDADFSVCGLVDEYGAESVLQRNENYTVRSFDRVDTLKQIMDDKMFYGYACNKLFKKDSIGDLTFDENLFSCEDIDFSVKFAAACQTSAFTSEPLYHYRHHSQSMTGDFQYNVRKLSVLDAYEAIMPIFEKHCPLYVYKLRCNYLKIAINIKGRMILSNVKDEQVAARIASIIQQTYPLVRKERAVSLKTKLNIALSVRFPGLLLRIKQSILQLKFRRA